LAWLLTPFINTALFRLAYDFGNVLKLLLPFITLKQMARCQWFFVIYRGFTIVSTSYFCHV
jgi:hypothetical protein